MPELFNGKDFSSYHDAIKYEIQREIEGCDKEYIIKIHTEKYCEYLISNHSIEPITLFLEEKVLLEPQETEARVQNIFGKTVMASATRYTLVIPFKGNSNYFYFRPNPHMLRRHKEGVIYRNELHISFTISVHSSTILKREIEDVIEDIEYHINAINKNLEEFNRTLGNFI